MNSISKTVVPYAWFFLFIVSMVTGDTKAQEGEEEKQKASKVVTAIRITGPEFLNHGPNLVGVRVQYEGSDRWRFAKPDEFQMSITGDTGKLVPDISGQPVNPVLVQVTGQQQPAGKQLILVRCEAGKVFSERRFEIRQLTADQSVTIRIDPDAPRHRYTGMGAGLMFYDNQFTIDKQLFDWCFKDVDSQILHVLIRPDFEPVNDNDDWQVLDNTAFKWDGCKRLFWICWNARQRNPDLKVYACLYSPPAWMKANDDTAGDAGLKAGEKYQLEMAEYVYAFLKHAAWKGTKIDYLCLFNEPDFPHHQDGSHYPSLVELAKAQAFISSKVDQLIDADPDFNHKPQYVFPETLGPGSITRAGEQTKALAKLTEKGALDHLSAWGVHDYWNSGGGYWENRYQELRDFPGVGDRPIWMTEWAQRYQRGDLASSMEYGEKILNALRLGASAWLAFEWAHPAPNQAGLISTQWGEGVTKKRFWRSKSYYVFKQIANTTPAGGNVVSTGLETKNKNGGKAIETLAVRDQGRMVVHLLNPNNGPVEYEVEFDDDKKVRLTSGRLTNPENNDVEIKNPFLKGELPPYTLMTLEFEIE